MNTYPVFKIVNETDVREFFFALENGRLQDTIIRINFTEKQMLNIIKIKNSIFYESQVLQWSNAMKNDTKQKYSKTHRKNKK